VDAAAGGMRDALESCKQLDSAMPPRLGYSAGATHNDLDGFRNPQYLNQIRATC
jgi:hypothetical protein